MNKLMTMVALCCLVVAGPAQENKIKSGLTPEDWAYKMAEGVTAKEVTYYSHLLHLNRYADAPRL